VKALAAAVAIMLGSSLELRTQTPVRPVDDGFPRYPVASVETRFAELWRQRGRHPYVCLIGRVALDSSAATYVEVDSLRPADEPWTTCNDPPVMGLVKMVDQLPAGMSVDVWGETMLQQLVAVALRQPNWRVIGVMFAIAGANMSDSTVVDAPSLVPAFLWLPRTEENVRVLNELTPLQ